MGNSLKKDFSIRQESNIAELVGGRTTPSLGLGHYKREDIIVDDASFLLECKTSTGVIEYFTLKKYRLEDNKKEAEAQDCKYSSIAFNFTRDGNYYFIIDEQLLLILLDKLKELK